MLSKIFVQRAIQLKSKIPFVMAEMAQCNLQNYKDLDNRIDQMAYAEAKLLSNMKYVNNVNLSSFNEMEQIEFKRSLDLLKQFKEMDTFCTYAHGVYKLIYRLYIFLNIDIAQSNFMAFNQITDEQFTSYLDEAMKEYQVLLDSVKDSEDWTKKLEEEIGTYWSQIHSLHINNKRMENILESHNFSKEYFFK